MRNAELWKPSKYIRSGNSLIATDDPAEVGVGSRMAVAKEAPMYWRLLREHARGSLIDVGCGKVPLYEVYRDCVNEVVCIDWVGTLHTSPHLDLEADLNLGMPFPDERFDTILCTSVLEHLRRPDLFWSEAWRILRPQGKVILSVPFMYWIHEEPHDYFRFTKYQLELACKESSLSLISIEPMGGPLRVILDVAGKTIPNRLGLQKGFQSVANWFVNTWLGRRMDERKIDYFPQGYCLVAQKMPLGTAQ